MRWLRLDDAGNFAGSFEHPTVDEAGVLIYNEIEVEDDDQRLIPPPIVPEVVTMRQARIALLRAGLLQQVDAAIAAMPAEVGGDEARITWGYGAEVRRDGPLIGQLAPGLSLTPEAVDNLFIEAATL